MPPKKGSKQRARLATTDAGGKSHCTPERIELLVEGVKAGLNNEAVAALAEMSPALLRRWRAKGRQSIEPYATLVREWDKAAAELERGLVQEVLEAQKFDLAGNAFPDVKARQWFLERRFPDRYNLRSHDEKRQQKVFRQYMLGLEAFMSPQAFLELVAAIEHVMGVPDDEREVIDVEVTDAAAQTGEPTAGV